MPADALPGEARNRRSWIGRSVPRLEDGPLVRGEGRFVADLSFPGELHARVVRSPHAHGRIVSIDLDEARAAPGVVAVWTAEDLGALPPIPFRATAIQGLEPYCQPALARDVVRYVGEPVALVVADDPYRAEDAAELVMVEVEDLPPPSPPAPRPPTGRPA